jgi:DNA excision repair protein ERCC-2
LVKVVGFAIQRYARADKRRKLPRWIQHHMSAESMDLSVERAVTMAKQFMRSMAQPHNRDNDIGTTLLTAAQAQALPTTVDSNAAEPMEY